MGADNTDSNNNNNDTTTRTTSTSATTTTTTTTTSTTSTTAAGTPTTTTTTKTPVWRLHTTSQAWCRARWRHLPHRLAASAQPKERAQGLPVAPEEAGDAREQRHTLAHQPAGSLCGVDSHASEHAGSSKRRPQEKQLRLQLAALTRQQSNRLPPQELQRRQHRCLRKRARCLR